MHTMDTMGYGHSKKYRPPLSPTNFYQPDPYSRHTTLRPQSEYRFAGSGYARTSSTRSSSGLCSAALVGGALLAAIAVLAVAALAFYMGALRPDSGEPIMAFEGTMRVTRGDVYGGAPNSPAWRERARRYGAALRQVYAAPSTLRQAFAGALVTGFGDRRLDVHFRLYLDRRKIPSTVSNIEETLKNILVQDILSKHPAFGQIKIDTSSINIKRDLEHTYHSESYVKEAMNESMASNNSKTPPKTDKDKVLQSRVGVVRKTTVKPNQKRKDPDEPDIDTDNIPVLQGTFQITKTEADITENKQNSGHVSHKPATITKATTTTQAPITKTSTQKYTTQKTVPPTTPNPRPFTIKSTLNIKTRTDANKATSSTTSAPSTTTLTTVQTTTNNVSQILLDLLTSEHHFKDIPKIDTLFTVPHVVDNEPWKPITKPYYETTKPQHQETTKQPHYETTKQPYSKTTKQPHYQTTKPPMVIEEAFNDPSEPNMEDRIGVAEVVEDISILESMLTPIPPLAPINRVTTTPKPPGFLNVDTDLAAEVYVPSLVYTSFTLPTYQPPVKNMETLGSHHPKPHPIPVDKISEVVEESYKPNPNDEDDGKPVERPPKDKTTSATLNVMTFEQQDNSTEKVLLEGTSILKKHDIVEHFAVSTSENVESPTTVIASTIGPSTKAAINPSTASYVSPTSKTSVETTESYTTVKEQISDTEMLEDSLFKENSTRRPNNKVSIIPTTSTPHLTWELVNTSTNDKNDTKNKHMPEKFYNDTLQAIITKNDALFPNTTPKFNSKVSILKNLTDIIKRYSQNSSEKPPKEIKKVEAEERHNHNKITGSVEVVAEDDVETTTPTVITLLPAKSNLGVNRPLRPRPKLPGNKQQVSAKEDKRSFFRGYSQVKSIIEDLSTESHLKITNATLFMPSYSEIVTASTVFEENPSDDQVFLANVSESMKVGDDTDIVYGNNRLPKSSDNLSNQNDNEVADSKPIGSNVPDGTYKVSYHVTGSVSSKQSNKTQSLPAYELELDPDVVLEIPVNQSNTLTVDKLRQLASLATISDSNNNTLFRTPGGGVISTKAIPSSYTLNQAGFQILTKTYNKVPTKEDNSFDKSYHDKNYGKPYLDKFEKEKKKEVVKEIVEECNNITSFKCPNGSCLAITSRCNRMIDCPGGEDERACTCADYLRAEFSQSKICDGVVDCWDYSDEKQCDWCSEGQYVCANAKQCIDMGKVCDGQPDCPLGDDEKSCVALADELEDNEVVPYNDEGYVMVRKRGVWGRLCVENFQDVVTQAHSSLKLPDLGRAVCRAMTYQDSPWAREAREGRKSSAVGYWEVWHNTAARAADTRLTFKRSDCNRHKALRVRCKDLDCGIRPHADVQQPRVVGGGGAAAGAWPWQAALYRDGDFQCGGTLVTKQWLLSASHCFYQATEAHWVARLGALRRGAWPKGPWEVAARVKQVVLHPRYAPRGFRNDIALLRVDPLNLHARLRPACLPQPRAQPPTGHHCTVVGWGQLYEHERVFPDTLQEVELPVISTAECRRRTRLLPLYRVTDDMFCAGYERGGRDACLGDSGGPLMCQESERWYIYGVTSNGYGCARANRPGVYTKVSNYIDWIDNVIATHTPSQNETTFYEDEDFYSDLEVAENNRPNKIDTCKGYRCPLGECLPASSICNGFIECSDGSDEWQCSRLGNDTSLNPD